MLFIIVLYLLINIFSSLTALNNVGSCLFYEQENAPHKCWTPRDIAVLRARRLFEDIIPTQVNLVHIDNKYVKNTLKYYRKALHEVDKLKNDDAQKILQAALVDTIGAHMRSELLPSVRFAYYAGFINYRDVRNLHGFYDGLKLKLNTQGQGWKEASKIPPQTNLTVAKILVGTSSFFDPCKLLIVTRYSDGCFHLPMPKVDDKSDPSSIALPFKNSGLVSMTSPIAESIILKYYQIAARCILHSSPPECRHSDFVNYNNEIWEWLQEHVQPRLVDEKLYAAYGGVLRVVAAVQTYGRDLKRRNLRENDQSEPKAENWAPQVVASNSLKEYCSNCEAINYVYYIIVAAVLIVLLQIVYHRVWGEGQGFQCKQPFELSKQNKSDNKSQYETRQQVAYSDVEMKIPALLPSPRDRKALGERIRSHASSIHTQRVYDLNENKEKMMAFIDESDAGSLTSETDHSNHSIRKNDTPAQLKVDKTRQKKPSTTVYSNTSTESTYRGPRLSHYESRSDSSMSSSGSSGMSKSQQVRRANSSRDLAWARRVVKNQMARQTNRSDENMGYSSYTTLTSKV